jgi:hypothetical protein
MKTNEELKTPGGLLLHLADTMISLEKGKIQVEEAKAQASLVKQSNNLFRYQLDELKFKRKINEFEKNNLEK